MEEEADLREQLSRHQPQEPEYASLLDQLASLKITHGQVQEAQGLFKELASLRANKIKEEALLCSQSTGPGDLQASHPQTKRDQHAERTLLGLKQPPPQQQQQQQQQQQSSRDVGPEDSSGTEVDDSAGDSCDDGDGDDWEERDWDQALESIRPVLPAPSSKKAADQPPPLRQKSPAPTAADVLSARSMKQRDGSEDAPGVASGKQHHQDGPQASERLEELDPAEVVTSWSGGFDHCLELGGLTSDVRTGDLQELLDSLLPDEAIKPYIRWVDDNHAVLVCANVTAANNLLDIASKEGMVVRPFLEATQASKQLPISELLPPKNRPKTSTAVARRLMSHALGLPGLRDRAGERDLAAARKQAREERRAKQQAAQESMAAAWGDD